MSMSSEETQRLAAALEQLEAEQRRREDEKIAAGQAVRLPLDCVVGVDGDANKLVEEAKAHKIAAARAAGETREIIFEQPTILVTGVPRGGEFGKWEQREPLLAQYPNRYAAEDRPTATAPPKPAPVDPDTLEWRKILVTIASPRDERDPGIVAEGRFAVDGKTLYVKDQQGKVFSQDIKPGDNAEHAARRLLKEKHGQHGEFYGAVRYPPRSIH
jgi:hypothetical protein